MRLSVSSVINILLLFPRHLSVKYSSFSSFFFPSFFNGHFLTIFIHFSVLSLILEWLSPLHGHTVTYLNPGQWFSACVSRQGPKEVNSQTFSLYVFLWRFFCYVGSMLRWHTSLDTEEWASELPRTVISFLPFSRAVTFYSFFFFCSQLERSGRAC